MVPTPEKGLNSAADDNLMMLASWGKGTIQDAEVSPDLSQLAVATTTGLYLYDPTTLQEKSHLDYQGLPAYSLMFSTDGQKLAVKFGLEAIAVYSFPDQKWIPISLPDDKYVFTNDPKDNFAFSSDGHALYLAKDGGLALINSSTGGTIKRTSLPDGETHTPILISADGKNLFHFEWDVIHVINLANNTEISSIPLSSMRGYIRSADGRYLVVIDVPGYSAPNTQLLVIDTNNGKLVQKIHKNQFGNAGGESYYNAQLAISPDSTMLAVSYSPGPLCLWNLEKRQSLGCIPGLKTADRSEIAFSPDGQSIFFNKQDGIVAQWNIAEKKLRDMSAQDDNQVTHILPTGTNSVIVERTGKGFDLYSQSLSLYTGEQRKETAFKTDSPIRDLRFSVDGKTIITVEDKAVKLWNVQNGEVQASISTEALLVKPSLDGSMVAVANRDNSVQLYTLPGAEKHFTLSGHTNAVTGMFFLQGKNVLVTTAKDETIVWDTVKGTSLFTLPDADSVLQIIPTGNGFATVDREMTIKVWDLQTRTMTKSFESQNDSVKDLQASEYAGNTLAVLGSGSIELTDMQSGVAQKPITVDGLHTARVAMDAGGKHVIAAAADCLLVFDTATGKQVSSQPGTVDLFDVSSRDGRLATVNGSNVQVWSPVGNGPITVRSDFSAKDRERYFAYVFDTQNLLSRHETIPSALVTGSSGYQLFLNPDNGNSISSTEIPQTISIFNYAPDASLMGFGGNDKNWQPTIRIRPIKTGDGEDLVLNPPHQSKSSRRMNVASISISNTGLIASAVDDGEEYYVDIWKQPDTTPLATLSGCLTAISADGKQLVVVERKDGAEMAVMYDLSDPANPRRDKKISIPDMSMQFDISAIIFNPDGSRLALSDITGKIYLIDTQTAGEVARVSPVTVEPIGLAFSANGRQLYSMTSDGVVRVWGVGEEQAARSEGTPTYTPAAQQASPEGHALNEDALEVISPENIDRLVEISVWEANACPTEGQFKNCSTHLSSINGKSRILPEESDNNVFYLGGPGIGSKYIINPWSNKPVQPYTPPNDLFYTRIAISPDGHMLVDLAMMTKTINMLSDTGEVLFELKGHTLKYLIAAAFSPDGRYLVTGFTDNDIHSEIFVWDTQTGILTGKLQDTNLVNTLAFIPDDVQDTYTLLAGYLFNMDYPDSFKTYSINAQGQIQKKSQAKITKYGLDSLVVSPDGKLLAIGEGSGFITILSPDGKQKYTEIDTRSVDRAMGFAFLPSGKGLLISRGDGTVALYGVKKQ